MNNTPSEFYLNRIKELEKEHIALKARNQRIVTIRLSVVVFAIVLGIVCYRQNFLEIGAIVISIVFAIFLWMIKYHDKIKRKVTRVINLLLINRNELKAIEGNFDFAETGEEFIDFDHKNLYDLDLFGKKSLYQRLNRTTTVEGKKTLAEIVKAQKAENITEQKSMHIELSKNALWRQDFQSTGMLAQKNKGYEDLKEWFAEKPILLGNMVFNLLAQISPFGFAVVLLLYIFDILPQVYPIAYFFAHLGLTGIKIKPINALHSQLSKKQNNLDAYAGLLQELTKSSFENAELKDWNARAKGGYAAITKLKRLINLLDSRLNMLMGIVLNGALLWDLRLVFKIENWKQSNSEKLGGWINVIAKAEAHSSLSNYVFNHPDFTWPNTTGEKVIDAKEMGHPFLNKDIRINNDFELNTLGQVVLLSGANMSGKSTFLRTVGLNLVMAKIGLPVCATSFSFKPIPIYTSMRINDSLQESESYFFAELKRLKFVIDTIKRGEEIFVLLDEILRGTNSNDKHKGSAGLIKQLISLKTSGIVASHDITLSKLENEFPNLLLNRSFEVENLNGELVFDYKLREGVCQNLNASYLMEKMGIV